MAARHSGWRSGCGCGGGGCSTGPSCGGVVQPLQLTAQFCSSVGDHCGSSSGGTGLDDGGMGSVNFSNGNLMLKIGQVTGGAFSPVPQAAYNAAAANSSNLGYGWSGLFNQQLATVDAN